jgi:hypothetical protein
MKKSILYGILLLLSACGKTLPNVPSDIIQKEKMIQILVDVHVADAVLENKNGTDRRVPEQTTAIYTQIYKNHGITRAEFLKSYHYYETQPELMDKLYEELLSELSRRQAQLSK